ncbi:hypothetical protein HPB50_000426 [Hyalomma asiaticum]|uniref:Uncharacterized protein n=1 Tax=Hyalomma asiaticum TaxID=266040 RepID=A0ACB7RL05_HYAAI|nr:hypothetical protein HPB50_000426 [Hyalomma asiaticum]
MDVVYGNVDRLRGKRMKAVKKLTHPYYDPETYHNDIAVVKVERPFTSGDNVRPICVLLEPTDMVDVKAIVAGWGRLAEGGAKTHYLHHTSLRIMPHEDCKMTYHDLYDEDVSYCAYQEDTDTCQVRLLVYLNGSSPATCGGAVITRWHILTAGHCVVRNHHLIPKIEGIYGATDTTSKYATRTQIAAVAVHPRFSEDEYHDDIAVLKVPRAFNFDVNIRPVCLDFDLGDLTGKDVTVAGWGVQKSSRGPSDKLRYTKLQVLQQSECERKMQSYKFNKSSMMCAYGEDTDACQGDSGSPVMFRKGSRYMQVGIVSHGVGCAQGMPGMYVPVSAYKEWIVQTIADESAFKPISGQNMVR